jgi:hypothetical protein
MYTELWNLCAGPLVTVPRVGDKVYYFPQGHIEQVSCPIRLPSLQAASSASTISRRDFRFARLFPGFAVASPVTSQGGVSAGRFSGIPLLMGQFCSRELFSWDWRVLHHFVHFWILRRCLQFDGFTGLPANQAGFI